MKKSLNIFLAVLTVFSFVSCQKDNLSSEPRGHKKNMVITIQTPEALSTTKEIGDGTKAKALYYTAFVGELPIHSLENKVELVGGKAELNVPLVKNVEYKFVFWAQYEEDTESPYYDLDEFYETSEVTISYAGYANDENRDAFCASKKVYVGMPAEDRVINLTRPFAQINFGADDYDMVKYLDLHKGMTSETTIEGLPDIIKVLDGSVSMTTDAAEEGVKAEFKPAAIPTGKDEYLKVGGKDYGYVNMNYVLAPLTGEGYLKTVNATFTNGQSKWEASVENVPIARNHRTNIIGDIFSENANLEIIVDPDFTDDKIVEL